MEEILQLFPESIRKMIDNQTLHRRHLLQEIRVRMFHPIELIFDGHAVWLDKTVPDRRDTMHILNRISEFSLYRMEDELREGYVTIEGGHRIGLAGKVNTVNGSVKAIQHIAFFNIRIAKQRIGCASKLMPYLHQKSYFNTLIAGPPQSGKTTLIRDVVRLISSGWGHTAAQKVGIVDERSEIAGSKKGVPQHDVGRRTDVMDACPKAEGMMMMIRSMSPEILAVDEIGSKADVNALMEAINTGVTIICTIHGKDLQELKQRPSLQVLFQANIFQRIVFMDRHQKPGNIRRICTQNGETIPMKTGVFK
ncbi:stage III sporulation protein AA [Virgibacillus siamensis]|uniref:stage III sporulation protein AA n=1 Tax=Virgibacillus siamensis TaxID=480071 RepID=UPI000984E4FF|nr:stage III sporulation protein AA [Virgibacillus siamensis]